MNAAEIEAWTRANLRARRAYYAATGASPQQSPRICPTCHREHTGETRTCGACRMRTYRAKAKAAKVGGPQMERRYWLTERGYAAVAEIEGRTA